MPRLGRRGSGLIGTAAKTAVVAGTATATVGAVSRATGGGNPPPAQPAPQAIAPPATTDRVTQLKDLAKLRDEGVLTEAEFESEKQRILAS